MEGNPCYFAKKEWNYNGIPLIPIIEKGCVDHGFIQRVQMGCIELMVSYNWLFDRSASLLKWLKLAGLFATLALRFPDDAVSRLLRLALEGISENESIFLRCPEVELDGIVELRKAGGGEGCDCCPEKEEYRR
jgi:hypothetical protein